MKKLALTMAALLLCWHGAGGAPCHAEEASPTESARELMISSPLEWPGKTWEAGVDGVWLPRSNSSDAGGGISMTEAKLKFARTFRVNDRLKPTPDLTYSELQVSAPYSARLPEHLQTLSLGLRGDYRAGPKLSLSALFAPGLAGDFRQVGADDLRVRLGVTGRYLASDRWTLLAGLIYQQGNHALAAFPMVGALYRPDERWTFSLAAPRSGVSYAATRNLKLHLGAEFFSGEYQLHEERLGAKVVRYRDFRAVGGTELTMLDRLKLELNAGYAFARRFAFYEVFAAERPDLKVDPGVFGRAGLKLEW